MYEVRHVNMVTPQRGLLHEHYRLKSPFTANTSNTTSSKTELRIFPYAHSPQTTHSSHMHFIPNVTAFLVEQSLPFPYAQIQLSKSRFPLQC